MKSKQLILAALSLITALRGFAALEPYVRSLDSAEAIAVVTVTTTEQIFDGSVIRESATLRVDTPIVGVKEGQTLKQMFGLPQQPVITRKDGSYSQKMALGSDMMSFRIAERYLVLLGKEQDAWIVTRASWLIEDMIADGYFETFAGAHDVSLAKAIELLKAYKKSKEPNSSHHRQLR